MSEYKKKFVLDEERIPKAWYNIVADLPAPPPPPLNPATLQPAGPDDLSPIFPPSIIAQEVSAERYIEIPEEVHQIYRIWRPTPLIRATGLEKALDTPAKIFFKYEGVSPAGSHKSNTAVAQAYYNKLDGTTRLATETGAGQWGCALSMACQMFDLECMVYMVKVSYHQKPYRRSMMQLWGANVIPSPSDQTNAGRAVLAEDPESLGSLGIAISEAVEDAVTHPGSKYALGSVTNHVLLHQTVIGEEAILQCQDADAYPDVVIGCVGGGSSFGGIALPLPAREPRRQDEHAPDRRGADRLPDAHQGPVRATTSATRPRARRCSRCTRSATTSCRPASTPAACATTPWRRCSATCTTSG